MVTLQHEERLQKMFQNVNEWLKFAEAKNFGLLTLDAALVIGISQIGFKDQPAIGKSCCYVLMPFVIISFIFSLISLFPILSKIEKGSVVKIWISKFCNFLDTETMFENIHFYGYLKSLDEDDFESKYLKKVNSNKPLSQFERELVVQILYNSRITWLKYQFFKIGAFFLGVGIVLSILSSLILKIVT